MTKTTSEAASPLEVASSHFFEQEREQAGRQTPGTPQLATGGESRNRSRTEISEGSKGQRSPRSPAMSNIEEMVISDSEKNADLKVNVQTDNSDRQASSFRPSLKARVSSTEKNLSSPSDRKHSVMRKETFGAMKIEEEKRSAVRNNNQSQLSPEPRRSTIQRTNKISPGSTQNINSHNSMKNPSPMLGKQSSRVVGSQQSKGSKTRQ